MYRQWCPAIETSRMSPATRYQYSRRIFTVAQRDTEYIEARGHRPIVTPREPIRIMMLRKKKDGKKKIFLSDVHRAEKMRLLR